MTRTAPSWGELRRWVRHMPIGPDAAWSEFQTWPHSDRRIRWALKHAIHQRQPALVQHLAGALFRGRQRALNQALLWAADEGDLGLVQTLVEAGANLETQNHRALARAARHGHLTLVRYLSSHLSARTHHHLPIHEAIAGGHWDVLKVLLSQPDHVASYNQPIWLLPWVAASDQLHLLDLLLDQPELWVIGPYDLGSVEALPHALETACRHGNLTAFIKLKARTDDLTFSHTQTLIKTAAEGGHLALIQHLLQSLKDAPEPWMRGNIQAIKTLRSNQYPDLADALFDQNVQSELASSQSLEIVLECGKLDLTRRGLKLYSQSNRKIIPPSKSPMRYLKSAITMADLAIFDQVFSLHEPLSHENWDKLLWLAFETQNAQWAERILDHLDADGPSTLPISNKTIQKLATFGQIKLVERLLKHEQNKETALLNHWQQIAKSAVEHSHDGLLQVAMQNLPQTDHVSLAFTAFKGGKIHLFHRILSIIPSSKRGMLVFNFLTEDDPIPFLELLPHLDLKSNMGRELLQAIRQRQWIWAWVLLSYVDCNVNEAEPFFCLIKNSNNDDSIILAKQMMTQVDLRQHGDRALREAIQRLQEAHKDNKSNTVDVLLKLIDMLLPYGQPAAQNSLALAEAMRANQTDLVQILLPHSQPDDAGDWLLFWGSYTALDQLATHTSVAAQERWLAVIPDWVALPHMHALARQRRLDALSSNATAKSPKQRTRA